MSKMQYDIEYPLNNASRPVLWNSIGTPLGLSEWFADGVTVDGYEYTFAWEKFEQVAHLICIKPNVSIQFRWEEDMDMDAFFEMRIDVSEISGELALFITDFAEPDEVEDAVLLWNKQVELLRRKTGM